MRTLCIAIALAGSAALMAGCTHHVGYNPGYVPPPTFAVQPAMQGKGLLYMDPADESYVYRGRPSSFTGGGSTLEIPMGRIAREVSTYY